MNDMNMCNVNMTVGVLEEILKDIPKNTPIIIPVIDAGDSDQVLGFRYVRTAGLLEDEHEEDKEVLCLSSSESGLDISEQIKNYTSLITCKRVLF